MIDLTNKINKIPEQSFKAIHIIRESLIHLQKKEQAVLTICGGFLGDCYLMSEVIDWILTNGVLESIKSQKWYKQKIKYYINTSVEKLKHSLFIYKEDSPTSKDYMQEVADGMYEEMKEMLFKLKNAIIIFLGNKIKGFDTSVIADFLIVDMLLRWVTSKYDRVIDKMKLIYNPVNIPDFYDSWYGNAKNLGAANNWILAVEEFSRLYIKDIIDLNKSQAIVDGINALDSIMTSDNISSKLRQQASEWAGEDKSINLFNDALEFLGLDEESKQKDSVKKLKKEASFQNKRLSALSEKA